MGIEGGRVHQLRVCNVDEEGRFGGPERRIINVAVALKKMGINTHILFPVMDSSIFKKNIDVNDIESTQIDITRLSKHWKTLLRYGIRFFGELFLLIRFFLINKFDLIHVNGSYQFKVAIAARISNTPIVWHLNDTYAPSVLKRVFQVVSNLTANGYIVAGERVREYYLSHLSLDNLPISEIHAPVDVDRYNPERFASRVQRENERIVIGTVSGLNPAKGLVYFIEMAERLRNEFENVTFKIAGAVLSSQRAYSKMLTTKLQKFGLENVVEFVGFLEDVPSFLNKLDICVFTSVTEASPTSIWEALAMEKPVVTTDVGSVRQYIINEHTGYVVPVADVNALSKYTSKLIVNSDLRLLLGKNARKVANECLSIKMAAEKHEDIYQKVLDSKQEKNNK